MRARFLLALLALGAARAAGADDPPPPPPGSPPAAPRVPPDDAALEKSLASDVRRLAASDLGARWNPSDRERAARWFADRLEAMGIAPAPGATGRLLEFPGRAGKPAGWNVAGWIPGEDEGAHVILAAHVDRAPFDPATKSPGADEASGAAAVLAAAADLAAGPRPRRSVLVVAFDLSGRRGLGARAYLAAPAVPLERLAGAVVVDRMGRSLGDAWPGLLCVHGTERSVEIQAALAGWTPPAQVSPARMGLDFFGAHPTDAGPFEERKLPVLLLTSGLSRDEGTRGDAPDRLDAPSLLARARATAGIVRAVAAAPARPAWVEEIVPTVAEARVVQDLVRRGLARDASAPDAAVLLRQEVHRFAGDLVARGTVTRGERTALRILALQAFGEMSRAPE